MTGRGCFSLGAFFFLPLKQLVDPKARKGTFFVCGSWKMTCNVFVQFRQFASVQCGENPFAGGPTGAGLSNSKFEVHRKRRSPDVSPATPVKVKVRRSPSQKNSCGRLLVCTCMDLGGPCWYFECGSYSGVPHPLLDGEF